MEQDIQREAARLIRNITRYLGKDAKDIMTHRRNIVAIDAGEDLESTLKFMLGEKYSRFPVYEESIDEITGFFYLREAMAFLIVLVQNVSYDLLQDIFQSYKPGSLPVLVQHDYDLALLLIK